MPHDTDQKQPIPPGEVDPLKFLRESSQVRNELTRVSFWRDIGQPFVWSMIVAASWLWRHGTRFAIVGGLLVWAGTAGGERGSWWPAINYLALGVAAFTAARAIATHFTSNRQHAVCAGAIAIIIAWITWARFDSYAVRFDDAFSTTYTRY